jgi:GNAT superfamily N-acetyltransferase
MANESVVLRAATETDVPAILSLIEALADYEQLRDACVATDERLRATLFGADPKAEVILAETADGVVAGFALFCSNYSTFLAKPGIWLEDLFVRPEFRGGGIGKLLLAHLAQLAIQRDCGRVEWAVLDWNTPSIGFYESLGARGMTEWTTFRLTGEALAALATVPA